MASAVVLGMIVGLFPDPAGRARAMGVYAFVGAAGASIGVVLGGVLTETVGWRWIFLVNVPIGLVAALLAVRTVVPDRPGQRTARADVLGGVLVTAGLMLAVLTIVDASGPLVRAGTGALSLALLAAFVLRQRRVRDPLVRLGIFRSRAVSGGNLVQLLMVAGMLGFQFIGALYMQRVGYPPAATGLAMVPIPVVIAVVSLGCAGPLIARFVAVLAAVAAAGSGVAGDPAGLAAGYRLAFLTSAGLVAAAAAVALPALGQGAAGLRRARLL